MSYIKEWEEEKIDFIPEEWSEEDEVLWNKLLPYVKEALYLSEIKEIRRIEARIADMPDIEPSEDFKIKMNKLFRDAFGENCKIPHPEVELRKSVNA